MSAGSPRSRREQQRIQARVLIVISFLVGVLHWIGDSLYDYFLFGRDFKQMLYQEPLSFWDSFLLNVPAPSLFDRVLVMAASLLAGCIAAMYFLRSAASEAEQRRSDERYRLLVKEMPLACFLLDEEDRCLSVNPAAMRMFGVEEAELQGRPLTDTILDADEWGTLCGRPQRLSISESSVVLTSRRRDGRSLNCEWHVCVVPGIGRLALAQDVSERMAMEDRLQQADKMRAIGQLAGGVAHDFNNQLSGIQGFAELLNLYVSSGDHERCGEYAGHIMTATQRAADLTGKLLAFSRRGNRVVEAVDLVALVNEAIGLLERVIDPGITIERDLPRIAMTKGDAGQLQSAILNLGLNARDAMPAGGTLSFRCARVTLTGTEAMAMNATPRAGDYWRVEVQDRGDGIDPRHLDQIFEPFFTTKPSGMGTGMGLPAVLGTVESHQGCIAVHSEPGEGTSFALYFPISDTQPDVVPENCIGMLRMPRYCVLVVDDEELVRGMAVDLLRSTGCEVESVEHGAACLEYLRAHPGGVDIVLLDMVMPHMDGRETYAGIREIDTQVRVVVMTGFSMAEDVQQVLGAGAAGVLAKPFRAAELTDAVRAAMS